MPPLPSRPDFDRLRHEARDLLRAAKSGDTDAAERIRAVSNRLTLASAQLAVARDYGFASWARLKAEVVRRKLLNARDVRRLQILIAEDPDAATTPMNNWCDQGGPTPLSYITMMRFNHDRLGLPAHLPGTGAVARALLAAGAPVNGLPGDKETPLITAASVGDAEVARALIDAGADLEATAAPNAGGIPGGTALLHAAVFGMTDVIDVLVAAGAHIPSLELAAAAGDISGWPLDRADEQTRLRALIDAADHQRLDVIDQLLAVGTPIDATDTDWGRQALRVAAQNGRPASVTHLLARGANPNLRDPEHGRTPIEWALPDNRDRSDEHASTDYDRVVAILQPVTNI